MRGQLFSDGKNARERAGKIRGFEMGGNGGTRKGAREDASGGKFMMYEGAVPSSVGTLSLAAWSPKLKSD
jgi:hypothetical protein